MSLKCGHHQACCSSSRWYMRVESHDGMILTGENWRTWRKTCPSATLFTTNPIWPDPGKNPGLQQLTTCAMPQPIHHAYILHTLFLQNNGTYKLIPKLHKTTIILVYTAFNKTLHEYSSYSCSTSALDRGEWSSLLKLWGKDPQYPSYRRLSGHQSRSGHKG
jgi:hypothetical protein